jgi:hypothetical protein
VGVGEDDHVKQETIFNLLQGRSNKKWNLFYLLTTEKPRGRYERELGEDMKRGYRCYERLDSSKS